LRKTFYQKHFGDYFEAKLILFSDFGEVAEVVRISMIEEELETVFLS